MGRTDKKSYGVFCYRNDHHRSEFIMVQKRITYAFSKFVNGHYQSDNNEEIISMFCDMTVDEKIILLTKNFENAWRHIWFSDYAGRMFLECRRKFEETFMRDGGTRLIKLINSAKTSGRLRWELPKGRKNGMHEMDLQCAVREFSEETGIAKSDYYIIPRIKRVETIIDDSVQYTSVYYAAWAKRDIIPFISFKRREQYGEICDIKWMTLEELRAIDPDAFPRTARIIRPLIGAIKKYL
jgi:8-oxo-dGTP pyrophosphatase MutT (NUDIX family)